MGRVLSLAAGQLNVSVALSSVYDELGAPLPAIIDILSC